MHERELHALRFALDASEPRQIEQTLRTSEERARRMAERMRAVAEAASAVLQTRTIEELDGVLREACKSVLPHDAFTFGTYDAATHSLRFVSAHDGRLVEGGGVFSLGGRPSDGVVRGRSSVRVGRADDPDGQGSAPFGTGRRSESAIRTPVLSGGRVLAVISVQSYTPDLYTDDDVEVLETFAAVAASAIRNIELLQERAAAHAALRDSEVRFRQLAESIPQAFWLSSLAGEILYVSPAFEQIWGRSAEEVTADQSVLLTDIHREDRERAAAAFAAMRRAVADRVEYRIIRPDGEVRWLSTSGFPTRGDLPGGRLIAGVTEDITRQRSLEEQLRQAQKMEAVGRLAGGIAHDFNNLLTAIAGNAALLLEEARPDNPSREQLQEIQTAAQRAASLTRQLLAFGRKQLLQPETIDLNRVVRQAHAPMLRLVPEGIALDLALNPSAVHARADPVQLHHVVLHLVENAREAVRPEDGRISVRTYFRTITGADRALHPFLRPGWYAALAVEDNGTGIAPDVLPRIFEPFFTTRSFGKGSGLGLSMVYGIMKQSGGYVLVKSEPGEGSTFEILLPRAADPPTEADAAAER